MLKKKKKTNADLLKQVKKNVNYDRFMLLIIYYKIYSKEKQL